MSIILCAKLINFQYIKIDGIFSYETNPNQTRNLIKKLNDEKYSIIFGSSRIQQVSSSIVKENLLNLNYIYARPDAIYDFLKKLDQNHWENIERIYVSLDLHSLTTEKYFVNVEEIFIETPKLEFLLQTIKESNLQSLNRSMKYLLEVLSNNQKIKYDDRGVRVYNKKNIWGGENPVRLKGKSYNNFELARYVADIEKLCNQKNKKVIFLTPVLSKKYYEQHKKFFEDFISSILKYTNEFYFFYYIKEISDNHEYFRDESHLNIDGMYKWFNTDWEPYKISKDQKILLRNK